MLEDGYECECNNAYQDTEELCFSQNTTKNCTYIKKYFLHIICHKLAASRIAISGNYTLRRPKRSKNEIVVPKEEEFVISLLIYFDHLQGVTEHQ